MQPLRFGGVTRVLAWGAHADDIEIGVGGTLLELIASNPAIEILWVVFSAPGVRAAEALASAESYLKPLDRKRIEIGRFRESYFPSQWDEIKGWVEELRASFLPDVVFTHCRHDRHQDHRVLSDLAWNAFRNQVVLEYEIPKYDGDLATPNLYVPISKETSRRKVAMLQRYFASQSEKHWFTPETFTALLRIRGVECASPSGYAEAFHARKLLLGLDQV